MSRKSSYRKERPSKPEHSISYSRQMTELLAIPRRLSKSPLIRHQHPQGHPHQQPRGHPHLSQFQLKRLRLAILIDPWTDFPPVLVCLEADRTAFPEYLTCQVGAASPRTKGTRQ